jgi:hypothetical protein
VPEVRLRRLGGAVRPEECGTWLTDEELGLVPEPRWIGEPTWDGEETLPCGCEVHPSDSHDIDDCLEQQADELAYEEDLRHEEAARYCPGCGDVHRFHDPCQAGA